MPVTWFNHVLFYVFAALVGLNLWVFAVRCERSGARAVRAANAWLLVLSSWFILLTFSESLEDGTRQDYLGPVINGYLGIHPIMELCRSYLAMNLFFRWPFLAAWVLVYGFVYYGLYRYGKERLILRVTAVCAGVYIATSLTDFVSQKETLFVLDCLGVASLLGAWKAKHRLNISVPIVVVVYMASFFVVFYNFDPYLTWENVNMEFIYLWGCSLTLFVGVTVAGWARGFFSAWSWILPFAFVSFLLFTNVNYIPAANYSNFLWAGLTLPRYFLSELAIVLLWLGMAWVYRRVRPKGSLLWLDAVSLVVIAIGLIDLGLTRIMSVRLDWQVLSLAFGETPKMMWRMSRPYLPAVGLALAAIAGIYAGVLAFMRRGSMAGNRVSTEVGGIADNGGSGSGFSDARWVLLGFALLGFAGVCVMGNDKGRGQALTLLASTSPLWQRAADPIMDAKKFSDTARELQIWKSPDKAVTRTGWKPAEGNATVSGSARDMNVIVIFQESTYNRFLSLFDGTNDTEPQLSKYKDRLELFPNFYSSFAGSINARFATFTGLYPVGDFNAFTTHHVPVESLFEVLHDNGYSNSMFYSSYFDYTGFRDFLRGRGIDEMYDADTMPKAGDVKPVSWGLREDATLGAITNQIKKYATARQKFCLTYVPAAPHNPFDGTPERFKKYRNGEEGDFTPAYKNELLFMDWVIGSIVDQLKESGLLDNTLILITGDHGEMLGENGGPIGHGWRLTPELGNVPLIVMNPKRPGYRVNDTVGSQVDMLPTILDLLGLPLPAGQLYQGASLYSADATRDRTIYLNTFQQYGVIESGRLFCGNRGQNSGGEGLLGFFSYTNAGSRTVFQSIEGTPAGMTNPVPSISDFDRFQGNFLHYYAEYCRVAQENAGAK